MSATVRLMVPAERRYSAGFSLVELMVSLALGTLVTLAAVSLFSTNQRTFTLQRDLSEVQEQGRFALDYMSRDLRMFGYKDPAVAASNPGDVGLIQVAVPVNGKSLPAAAEGGVDQSASDRLTFAFNGTIDCEGDEAAGVTYIVNTYWRNADDELLCEGSNDPNTTGIRLLENVDSFQVLYGLDAVAEDDQLFAGRYVPENLVGVNDNVVAIKVAFLASVPAQSPNDTPTNYMVLDKQLQSGAAPLDQPEPRLRRLFSTTIKARNYRWEDL